MSTHTNTCTYMLSAITLTHTHTCTYMLDATHVYMCVCTQRLHCIYTVCCPVDRGCECPSCCASVSNMHLHVEILTAIAHEPHHTSVTHPTSTSWLDQLCIVHACTRQGSWQGMCCSMPIVQLSVSSFTTQAPSTMPCCLGRWHFPNCPYIHIFYCLYIH
jgi:hypothetical protein